MKLTFTLIVLCFSLIIFLENCKVSTSMISGTYVWRNVVVERMILDSNFRFHDTAYGDMLATGSHGSWKRNGAVLILNSDLQPDNVVAFQQHYDSSVPKNKIRIQAIYNGKPFPVNIEINQRPHNNTSQSIILVDQRVFDTPHLKNIIVTTPSFPNPFYFENKGSTGNDFTIQFNIQSMSTYIFFKNYIVTYKKNKLIFLDSSNTTKRILHKI